MNKILFILIITNVLSCQKSDGPVVLRQIASVDANCVDALHNLIEKKKKGVNDFIKFVFEQIWHKETPSKVRANLDRQNLWNTKSGSFTQIESNGYKIIEYDLQQNDRFQFIVRTIHGNPHFTPEKELDMIFDQMNKPDFLSLQSASLIDQNKNSLFENLGFIMDTDGHSVVLTHNEDLHLYNLRADWKFSETRTWEKLDREGRRTGNLVDLHNISPNYPDMTKYGNGGYIDWMRSRMNDFSFDDLGKKENQLGTHKREHEFAAALLENFEIKSPQDILENTLGPSYYSATKSNNRSWNEVAFLNGPSLDNPKIKAVVVKVYKNMNKKEQDQYQAAVSFAQRKNIPLVILKL